MRKLASVQRILEVQDIKGKDRIGLATVLGWHVIVNKAEVKAGDLAVYFEIDSVLDKTNPVFAFMEKRNYRVKTLKMAGVVSQGLVMPLSAFPMLSNVKEGDDVTEALKVVKFNPEAEIEKLSVFKDVKKHSKLVEFLLKYRWFRKLYFLSKHKESYAFPSDIEKTDEVRIQSVPFKLSLYDGKTLDCSEKIDGCLEPNTLITTDKGLIPIRNIVNHKMDIKVLSYNENSKICEFKSITDYHKIKLNRQLYKIGVGVKGKGNRSKFITCTDNHKFLTPNGWKRADELTKEDSIYHYVKDKFPQHLKEVIIGCLLGDASLNSNSETGNYRTVRFCQSEKQKEYFNYKKQLFGKFFIQDKDAVSGYGSILHRGKLVANLDVFKYLATLFPTQKKIITKEVCNEITPISLAFWYMDDGSLKNRDSYLQERITLNTQGFSIEEVKNLTEALKVKFNIESTIGDKDTYKGFVIILDCENTKKFCSLIAPYICKSMKYKLPKMYENTATFFDNIEVSSISSIVKTDILSIEKVDKNFVGQYVYDLEVEDNHNYFAKSILVHNCSATFLLKPVKSWLGKRYKYIVCSRNLRVKEDGNTVYAEVSRTFDLKNKLNKLLDIIKNDYSKVELVSIQGEILAPKVQGNKYHKDKAELYVFNIIAGLSEGEQLKFGNSIMSRYCKEIGLNTVPMLHNLTIKGHSVDDIVELSKFNSTLYDTVAEGKVYRVVDENGFVTDSFKVINPEFLIKYKL